MGVVGVIILLLHPLVALTIIYWMYKQYSYRQKRRELRGQEAKDARQSHERIGEIVYRSALAAIGLGLLANFYVGWMAGEGNWSILPSSFHGWLGFVGFGVLTVTIRKGRLVKKQRESREKFALELQRHGRASDVMMPLIFLHAFLGFIYLFQLLTR
jgi:hypothetical protein